MVQRTAVAQGPNVKPPPCFPQPRAAGRGTDPPALPCAVPCPGPVRTQLQVGAHTSRPLERICTPCPVLVGRNHTALPPRQQLLRPLLTMPRKEPAKGESPGIMGVQVSQREAQHTQCIPRLVVLQERQDAICGKKAWGQAGRQASHSGCRSELGPAPPKAGCR